MSGSLKSTSKKMVTGSNPCLGHGGSPVRIWSMRPTQVTSNTRHAFIAAWDNREPENRFVVQCYEWAWRAAVQRKKALEFEMVARVSENRKGFMPANKQTLENMQFLVPETPTSSTKDTKGHHKLKFLPSERTSKSFLRDHSFVSKIGRTTMKSTVS